jgi:hypothetical protein
MLNQEVMRKWIDEKVIQVFNSFLDELSNDKRIEIEIKCLTIEQKLDLLREETKKLNQSFK